MSDKIMKAFAKMLEQTMNPLPNHCVECDKPTQETLCSDCINKEEPENSEGERPVDEDPMTNCCSAHFTYPGWPDSDICSACYEHAGIDEDE